MKVFVASRLCNFAAMFVTLQQYHVCGKPVTVVVAKLSERVCDDFCVMP